MGYGFFLVLECFVQNRGILHVLKKSLKAKYEKEKQYGSKVMIDIRNKDNSDNTKIQDNFR